MSQNQIILTERKISIMTRKCKKCNITKSINDFPIVRKIWRRHTCKTCTLNYKQNWDKENVSLNRGYKRKWKKLNPQSVLDSASRKYHRDLEKSRAYLRELYKRNPQKHIDYSRKWQIQNPEKKKQIQNNWIKTEKGKASKRRYNIRKRTQKSISINDLTADDWQWILNTFKNCCAYCKRTFLPDNFKIQDKNGVTQDHVLPLNRSGLHTKSNIVPAHRSCNSFWQDKIKGKLETIMKNWSFDVISYLFNDEKLEENIQ